MRSVKQVKRAHRVRSLKNAAACKRNAYRRRMQAKQNWQTNTVFTGYRLPTINVPETTPRKIKEPKQRTPEEIAERQRVREQKRLEKELAKQKASTSALPKPKKIKKEKKPIAQHMEKIVQPKQQQPLKKEKPKKVAPEVSEQPQRVESDKRKGAAKEPKSEEKETKAAAEVSEAEKKEPKVTARESEPSSKELKQDTKKVKESIPESVSTKSNKKKSKKAVEHSVIDQQKVVEEVQPKKEESTAPASSPTSERQHTDDYFRENGNLHEERKGAEEARVPEPVDTAYRSNENVLEETMENGVVGVKDFIAHNSADADAAIESAEKAALREEPDAAVKDVHLPPNDADVAFAPVHASKQEKPSLIENHIEKVEQTENQGAPYAEQPCADAQHAPLMADTDHALLDEKHEEKSYQESKNHEEHDTKGKKQRRHKGRHSDSEKHGEEEQSEEHTHGIDEVAKEATSEFSKKHKKKRNRKSESEHHLPSPDEIQFVEGESVEMNEAEQAAGGDFTEVISRRHKKKGRPSESESAHEDSSATAELAKEPHKNGEEKHGAKSESVEVKAVPPAVTETSEKLVKEVVQPPVIVETGPYEGQYNEQSTQKTTEVITVGGEPTEGQVIVDKTVVTLDSGASPDQFAQNIAKLAEEHPELMKNANIELGEGITGKVTVTTYTTKTTTNYEPTNVIKRDPIVLAVEREKRTEMMRQRRERLYKLLPRDVEFCTRMIEAHGNDYEAMAKDPLNVHQETAKSIQRKIRIFRESPQFETYIQSKNNSPAPSPVPPPL